MHLHRVLEYLQKQKIRGKKFQKLNGKLGVYDQQMYTWAGIVS